MSTMRSDLGELAMPGATHGQAVSEPIRVRDVLTALIEQVMVWHERAQQRRHLQSLSDHMLHDIGIGRADVEAEISKPFWRP